jgi:hypothetical protein
MNQRLPRHQLHGGLHGRHRFRQSITVDRPGNR